MFTLKYDAALLTEQKGFLVSIFHDSKDFLLSLFFINIKFHVDVFIQCQCLNVKRESSSE